MTAMVFEIACERRSIDPAIALENEKIMQGLMDDDDRKVFELLDSEF
jgi:hypothetical protein